MISHAGEVPKRLKGLVSKTDSGRKSSEGSNPSFSANKQKWGTRENACPFSFHVFASNNVICIVEMIVSLLTHSMKKSADLA